MSDSNTPREGDDGASELRQFVSFRLGKEAFAFPMQSVREIIRLPRVVPVPMGPASLLGLMNLRGLVLPVIDLRRALSLPQQEATESTRVIVVDVGGAVGLVVDRVERVLGTAESSIDRSSATTSAVSQGPLAGVIRPDGGQHAVQIIDPSRLVASQIPHLAAQGDSNRARTSASRHSGGGSEEEVGGVQIVSFELGDETFAFAVEDVAEIVRVPDGVSAVPDSAPSVLGLMALRGRLLPLLSLRRILGLCESEPNDHNRVVVLQVRRGGHPLTFGVLVDRVCEVGRVQDDQVEDMPALLAQGRSGELVHQVCRLEEGRRLISLLTATGLVGADLQDALDASPDDPEHAMFDDSQSQDQGEDEDVQLVVFQLQGQEYAVSVSGVQEITRVPERITAAPHMPPGLVGMMNLRGTVLPVVDMRARFGLPVAERSDRQRVLILHVDQRRTGFITDSVTEVLRMHRSALEEAPHVSDAQADVMAQVVNLQDCARMIQVVDVRALLGSTQVGASAGAGAA